MPKRITDSGEPPANGSRSQISDQNSAFKPNTSDSAGVSNSLNDSDHRPGTVRPLDAQKFLNVDQLEAYFRANLEETELNLDDLIQLENNLLSCDKPVIEKKPPFPAIDGRSIVSKPHGQENQCSKQKSSKSKFLAKRNRLRMNKEVLVSKGSTAVGATGKWIGQTSSVGSSSSSSPMLSPCSSASDECATSSVEIRLSALGSSNYSLCSSSPNVNDEPDRKMFSKRDDDRPGDLYADEMNAFVEMNGKKNDPQYELFDITRSMPSLDLIESINGSNLPRLLKQFDKQHSQPKLSDTFYQDCFEGQSNKSVHRPDESIADTSLSNNQKLIMTRFGFIKTCPAAKNLMLYGSSTCLNEDEQHAKSLSNKDCSSIDKENFFSVEGRPSEIGKKASISSMDLSAVKCAKPLILLPKPINQRSLSALTINCDTNRANKPFFCAACSSSLCKCKTKANSLLALNHQPSMRPKIPKKPFIEVSTVCFVSL